MLDTQLFLLFLFLYLKKKKVQKMSKWKPDHRWDKIVIKYKNIYGLYKKY